MCGSFDRWIGEEVPCNWGGLDGVTEKYILEGCLGRDSFTE